MSLADARQAVERAELEHRAQRDRDLTWKRRRQRVDELLSQLERYSFACVERIPRPIGVAVARLEQEVRGLAELPSVPCKTSKAMDRVFILSDLIARQLRPDYWAVSLEELDADRDLAASLEESDDG